VYTFTERLAEDYTGGYWEFYQLSNGGFYMTPADDRHFHVTGENHFEGDLSADALGITACLYAYSNLPFSGPDAFAYICSDQYYWLREYMMDHPEAMAILGRPTELTAPSLPLESGCVAQVGGCGWRMS
jgi:Antirestriction protein